MNAHPGSLTRPTEWQFLRTRPLRYVAYRLGRLSMRRSILDVGAGGGEVAAEIASRTGRRVIALDPVPPNPAPDDVIPLRGDAHALPFADGSFDAVCFHFVLMWLHDPVEALKEAGRVLGEEGVVMILSEPDLTVREDDPDTGLGRLLSRVVAEAGGHPDAGSRLSGWCEEAGLRPDLRESHDGWMPLDCWEEIAEEIRFLKLRGILGEEDAASLEAEEHRVYAERRVRMPITYGCAWR